MLSDFITEVVADKEALPDVVGREDAVGVGDPESDAEKERKLLKLPVADLDVVR
jgi:hypothetical protein